LDFYRAQKVKLALIGILANGSISLPDKCVSRQIKGLEELGNNCNQNSHFSSIFLGFLSSTYSIGNAFSLGCGTKTLVQSAEPKSTGAVGAWRILMVADRFNSDG
jgi:hypothetical protein